MAVTKKKAEAVSAEAQALTGTLAVQNEGDFNDPGRRHPSDPGFTGQGLDLSVYGKTEADKD